MTLVMDMGMGRPRLVVEDKFSVVGGGLRFVFEYM